MGWVFAVVLLLVWWSGDGQGGGDGSEVGEVKRVQRLREPPGVSLLRFEGALAAPVVSLRVKEPSEAGIPGASREVMSSSVVSGVAIEELLKLKVGDVLGIPIAGDEWLRAELGYHQMADGVLSMGGLVEGRAGHELSLRVGRDGINGAILLPDERRAFLLEPDEGGRLLLQEYPLDAVVCAGMPVEPPPEVVAMVQPGASTFLMAPLALDSLPGSEAVFYLDFDGEIVTDPSWNGGQTVIAGPAMMNGRLISDAELREVWEMVAEDFRPFNISVTTLPGRYAAAPVGRRMRCIVTPTKTVAPSAGGVAYLRSFSRAGSTFSEDIPCWSFNAGTTRNMAMTISHELGHTVGLRHDGRWLGYHEEYYYGHGSGTLSWGPIMGAPFGRLVTQWSKGDYLNANQLEDDLAIIANLENGFGFREDTVGDEIGTSKLVDGNFVGEVRESGILLTDQDRDVFRFICKEGAVLFKASPNAVEPNLKVKLELLNAAGDVLFTEESAGQMAVTLNRVVGAGVHYVRVSSGGVGDPYGSPMSGFRSYGSIGGYELTGFFTPLPMNPYIVEEPEGGAVDEGRGMELRVKSLSNSRMRYQWLREVNGVEQPVARATGPRLRIRAARASDAGAYRVRISNGVGVSFSEVAMVHVKLRPRVTGLPDWVEVLAGEDQVLSPTWVGEGPLTFQWYKNQVPMPGETGASLALSGVTWADAGGYRLQISNALGEMMSRVMRVVVNSPPVLLSSIPHFAVPTGGVAVLQHRVAGSAGMRYEWRRNGVVVSNGSGASLRILGVEGVDGDYSLRISNAFGEVVSEVTEVVRYDRLRITRQPERVGLVGGQDFVLSVEVAGDGPLFYQWQKNGVDLPGGNGAQYWVSGASWLDGGIYRVVVSNAVSRVVSRSVRVAVEARPEILVQPVGHRAARGGTTHFQVKAGGTGKLSYQWLKDGMVLPGEVRSKLRLRDLWAMTEGLYSVRVSNALGVIESEGAQLTVVDGPAVVLQPQPGYFPVGGTITAVVGATGEETLHFQWQRNGRVIPGQTSAQLSVPAERVKAGGLFRCVVSNDVGRVVSRAARMRVQVPPEITLQPRALTIYEGEDVRFEVRAKGAKTLRYFWFRDDALMFTGRTVSIKDARFGVEGKYKVVVTNLVGSVTSEEVELTMLAVPAPEVSLLVPTRATPGAKVSVVGSNLKFVRSLTLGARKLGYVITDAGELLASLPRSVRTPVAGDVVKVVSLGGEHVVSTPLFVGQNVTNDWYEHSEVLAGSPRFTWKEVTDFTHESDEYGFHTAWWRWIAPETGTFTVDTRDSNYDTMAAVYQEQAGGVRVLIGFNDDFFGLQSRVDFPAVKGAAYRISIGSFGGFPPDRRYFGALGLYPSSWLGQLGAGAEGGAGLRAGTMEPLAGAAVRVEADGESVRVGGKAAGAEPVVVFWRPAVPEEVVGAGRVRVSFAAMWDGPFGMSRDEFVWTWYDEQGRVLVSLVWLAEGGRLKMVNAAGVERWVEGVMMAAGGLVRFEVGLDLVAGRWDLSVDGVMLVEGAGLGAEGAGSGVGDVGVSWERGAGGLPGAMRFEGMSWRVEP